VHGPASCKGQQDCKRCCCEPNLDLATSQAQDQGRCTRVSSAFCSVNRLEELAQDHKCPAKLLQLHGVLRELEMAKTIFKSLDPNFLSLFGMQPFVHLRDPTTMRHQQWISLASPDTRELELAKTVFKSLDPNFPALFGRQPFCSFAGSNNNVASTRDLFGVIRELALAKTVFQSLGPNFTFLDATSGSFAGSDNNAASTRNLFGIIRELELAKAAFKSLDLNFPALFKCKLLFIQWDPTAIWHRQGISLASSESWNWRKLFLKVLIQIHQPCLERNLLFIRRIINVDASTRGLVGIIIRELELATTVLESLDPICQPCSECNFLIILMNLLAQVALLLRELLGE
jgi:hypothetical protein